MNEFIWDPKLNQFEFTELGFVSARSDVRKRECCYIGYGPEYDWDDYKTQIAHELAAALLLGARLFGHPSFEPIMTALLGQVVGWTKASLPRKREGTGLERLFMSVVDGTTPRELLHFVHPTFLMVDDLPEPVGHWIERFLCCSVMYDRYAFRKAHDPRLRLLSLEDCMIVTPAGSRSSVRAPGRKNYSELDDELEFPALPQPALRL